MLNYIRYYKTFLRYGLGYEGDAWFANNYISAFKDKGFYIDVGCYHPIKYSLTHKLHKIGWSGINIDISKESIDLFNIFRPKDKNLNIGISTESGVKDAFFEKEISPISSLKLDYLEKYQKIKKKFVRKIKTLTLEDLFEENKITEVDFLKIDCEGLDLSIIKTINFEKYQINFLCVEFLDPYADFINKKTNEIKSVHELFFSSEIYNALKENFRLLDHYNFAFLLVNRKIY